MIMDELKGYMEGAEISKIPANYMVYPSQNLLLYKGAYLTRGGTLNDGTAHTTTSAIHSEYVWKAAKGGAQAIRCWGQNWQIKLRDKWFTIFSALTSGTERVRFTPWVDATGTVIKSRLLGVDGSIKVFEWCGGVATIASSAGPNITISGSTSLLNKGFDPGNSSNKAVVIVRFDADGEVIAVDPYTQDDDCTDTVMHLTSTPSTAPTAGDLLVAVPTANSSLLTTVLKDDIYTYNNHVAVATLNSGRVYFSDAEDYTDFVIPGSKTALTPFFLDFDGNYTAMISRKGVLWVSTPDDWFKVTKTLEVNAYGFYTSVEKFEQAERTGSLPFAVSIYKGDIVFVGQDSTVQKITTIELLGRDDIIPLSDDIEGLLLRLDLDDVRVYHQRRYMLIVCPAEGIIVMRDNYEGVWQPPQTIAASCLSVIEGVQYGHSNSRNETFQLFVGRDDLGAPIEAKYAPGYYHGEHAFHNTKHQIFGLSARATVTTEFTLEYQYGFNGAVAAPTNDFLTNDIVYYEVPDDVSFGSSALGTRSFAGLEDTGDTSLKRFFIYDRMPTMLSYLEFRPVITMTGAEMEARIYNWWIDDKISEVKIPTNLFITREEIT